MSSHGVVLASILMARSAIINRLQAFFMCRYIICILCIFTTSLNSIPGVIKWPSMAGKTSIKSLAEQNLHRLAVALDAVAPNGEEYWRLLVDQLPRGSYQSWEVEKFAAATLQDRSPSLLLLENVQQHELVPTVEDLVIVLTRIKCQRALNVLALKCEITLFEIAAA